MLTLGIELATLSDDNLTHATTFLTHLLLCPRSLTLSVTVPQRRVRVLQCFLGRDGQIKQGRMIYL